MLKLRAKFGENRTNGSGVIQVFANFNMAAGGHVGLQISTFWDHMLVPGAKRMIRTKFGAYTTNRFEVIQFLVNFSFSSAAILNFENGGFDTSGVSAVSCRSSVPNLMRIGGTVRELYKFLQISIWRPAAILDYEF